MNDMCYFYLNNNNHVDLTHGAAVDVAGLRRGEGWQQICFTIDRDDYGCARRSGIGV